jgi:hypothetical protein
MGKNAALFHLSSLASLNASHLPRVMKDLRSSLEKAATGPALKYAMLVRDPGKGTSWESALGGGSGGGAARQSPFYRFFGSAFSESLVTAAVDLARASVLTTGKSRYDFLLDSLFGSAFSSEAPTTIEVSSFLSLLSPCSLRAVLDQHARYLRSASSVSSSSSSLSSSLSLSLSTDEHFRKN